MGIVAGATILAGAAFAAPGPTPSAGVSSPATPASIPATSTSVPATDAPQVPLMDVAGSRALWFIGLVTGAIALLWIIPLLYDTRHATKWRRENQGQLLQRMVDKTGTVSVEEIRQIVSAMNQPARGTFGLTQALLGLIIVTFVGVAMIATLVSTADDSSELRKTLVTALLSILATIAGFYFGARTAQTSTEQATRPPTPAPVRANGRPDGDTTTGDKRPEPVPQQSPQAAAGQAEATEKRPEDEVSDDEDVTHQDEDDDAETNMGDEVEYKLGDEKPRGA